MRPPAVDTGVRNKDVDTVALGVREPVVPLVVV